MWIMLDLVLDPIPVSPGTGAIAASSDSLSLPLCAGQLGVFGQEPWER